jgi:uncharacterized protein (TIGR02271 family)
MANIVASVFHTTRDAETAVRDLLSAGFPDDRIGVVVHDDTIGPVIADDLGREYRSGMNPPANELTSPSDVYEDLPGGFVKELRKDTTTASSVNWYTDQLNNRNILLIVNAGNRSSDATRILCDDHGMLYPGTMGTMPSTTATTTPTPTPMPETTTTTANEVHMPVIDEDVIIEKTSHQVGQVEVTSETDTSMVDVPATVTHQEIRVERHRLDRPMHPNDYKGVSAEGGVIRMPIIEEEVRVTKTPVIREELIITRVPISETQTFHETVMHTEPHVEATGDVKVSDTEMTTEERMRRERKGPGSSGMAA